MFKNVRSLLGVTILGVSLAGSAAMFAFAQDRDHDRDDQYRRENQPKMQEAMQELRQAEDSLNRADTDKGGHRVRAIELVRQAEHEVQAGIEYDNRHDDRR